MGKISYTDSTFDAPVALGDIPDLDVEEQVSVMRQWFEYNFEDPAEGTPYQTSEGGYLYLFDGPYYAKKELEEEFGGLVSEMAISQLVEELDNENFAWACRFDLEGSDYDKFVIGSVIENTEYHANFVSAIEDISALLNEDIDQSVKPKFNQLLYVNVITALETYLSDAFVNSVLSNNQLIRKFVETTEAFKQQKFPLCAIFSKMEQINQLILPYFTHLSWHDLNKVSKLYKSILEIDIYEETDYLIEPVKRRHDLVHRNGKTKDGSPIIVTVSEIEELKDQVYMVVDKVDDILTSNNTDNTSN